LRQAAAQELLEVMVGSSRKHGPFAATANPIKAAWMAAVVFGYCLGAAGCGSGGQQAEPGAPSVSKSHKAKKADGPSKPGEESPGDMVTAVSASKGPPVELKFALPVRPEVGQVTDIDVALVTSQPVPDSVSISFQVVDGLDIVDGSQMERVEKPALGTPIRHVVKVLPKRDGIFAVTAVVAFTVANQEMNRTFSIPVIAGQGLPDQVAKGP
jgi:hypothetical protein